MMRLFALGLAAVILAACGGEQEEPWTSPISFDTARAWVHTGEDSVPLLVELARTPEQQAQGLMYRPALDPGSGMAFLYDTVRSGDSSFWMFKTRIPLDIAFVDSTGVIDTILTMPPCESLYREGCPRYTPGVDYHWALEVNRGWFREHGVEVGDRAAIDSTAEAERGGDGD